MVQQKYSKDFLNEEAFPTQLSPFALLSQGMYALELFSLEVRGPEFRLSLTHHGGISGGSVVKNPPRDLGSIPGS